MDHQIVLGYWGIRGLGQVPRLLLTYTKANWKQKIYTNRDQWFNNDKKSIPLAFPNLPYILDGDLKISQSSAINRYIINKSKHKQLLGKDIRDQAIVDNILGVFADIRTGMSSAYFSQNYANQIKQIPNKIQKKLQHLQKQYGDKQFALGYLTLPDFIVAQNSYYIKEISEQLYKKFPFLDRVRQAVQALPQVQEYYKREGAIKQPFMPPNATLKPKLF